MTEITEICELSMDDLEAVSGGAPSTGAKILSAVCEVAGDVAHAIGANGAAYTLYMTAEGLLH